MSVAKTNQRAEVSTIGLHLSVRCERCLIAFDAGFVDRIIPLGEGVLLDDETQGGVGYIGTLSFSGMEVAAWDLGTLLGVNHEPQAWVVFRLPGEASARALRTGRCLVVSKLSSNRLSGLPRGVSQSWPGLFVSMFRKKDFISEGGDMEDVYGLITDVSILLDRMVLDDVESFGSFEEA